MLAIPGPPVIDQVPPDVALLNCVTSFTQIEAAPSVMGAIAGKAFTVTEAVVLVQPVEVNVKVKVTLPTDTPVIKPALVIVAIPLLLLTQVPPVFGDAVIVLLTQTEEADVLTAGNGFTVVVFDAGVNAVHTLAFV